MQKVAVNGESYQFGDDNLADFECSTECPCCSKVHKYFACDYSRYELYGFKITCLVQSK